MEHLHFLWALPLLALPWLLRLIRPQKPQRLIFPQSYLLREVLHKYQLRKKPNPLWLNLIRLAILLAMLLSLIGIYWPEQQVNAQASQILLLDDSFYTHGDGDRQMFERQKTQAYQLLLQMHGQQDVAILGSCGRETPWLKSSEAYRELEKWEASYKGENWLNVGLHLNRLIRQSSSSAMELQLLGDGHSEASAQAVELLQRVSEKIVIHRPKLKPLPFSENRSLQVETWITDQHLVVAGRLVPPLNRASSLKLTFKDGRSEDRIFNGDFRWELPLATTALLEWVERDGFVLDQRVPITGEFNRQRRLFFLKHREAEQRLQDPDYYLDKGLQQICQREQWEYRSLFPSDWNNFSGDSGDIVVLQDPPFLSQSEAQKIERFFKKGGQIFLLCGPSTPIEIFDNCPWIPAQLLSITKTAHRIQWPKAWEESCPLFQALKFSGGWQFEKLQANAQVLARRDDGSPAWIRSAPSEFGGRVNLLSSPFHLSWSSATLQADFPTVLNLMISGMENSPLKRVIEAGSATPKGVLATRSILGSSISGECAPGLVEWTLDDGTLFPVIVQFSPERVKPRSALSLELYPELQKGPSLRKNRMDSVFAILALLFFLLETVFLIYNKKRLSVLT